MDFVPLSWKSSRCVVKCKCNLFKGKHFNVSETLGAHETPETPENAPEISAPENAPENATENAAPEKAAPESEPEVFMQTNNHCKCQVCHYKI